MTNNTRIPAFTIMEVTIVMILAALVIGITYATYSVVIGSYSGYHKKSVKISSLIQLNNLFKKDFAQAQIIYKDSASIVMRGNANNVKYEILPDYIVRLSVIRDTFKFPVKSVLTLFENRPVTNNPITTEEGRIDNLDFTVLFNDEEIPYHYHKIYSSVNLFQRNINAIN